jgi:hypothetical protein
VVHSLSMFRRNYELHDEYNHAGHAQRKASAHGMILTKV